MPFCHNGCPLGQPDPRLERPRLPRPLAGRDRAAARDQQLPRVHRPDLPGAVRGGLRARDQRGRRGDDQADRERDHRPRLGGGLGRRRSRREVETGQLGGRRRRRPGRAWRRRSSCAAPATRSTLFERDEAPAGWSASASRTSRSRSASSSAASSSSRPRASSSRCGVDVGARRRRRRAARALRRGRAGDRLARPRDLDGPGPRARRRPLRDGLPLRAQPRGSQRPATAEPAPREITAEGKHVVVIGGGDTGADCVGQRDPRGRALGRAARAAARAARRTGPTIARRGRCGR